MNISTDTIGNLLMLSIEVLLVALVGLIGAVAGFFIMCVLYVSWPWFTKASMPDDLEKRLFTLITRSGTIIAIVLYFVFRIYMIASSSGPLPKGPL